MSYAYFRDKYLKDGCSIITAKISYLVPILEFFIPEPKHLEGVFYVGNEINIRCRATNIRSSSVVDFHNLNNEVLHSVKRKFTEEYKEKSASLFITNDLRNRTIGCLLDKIIVEKTLTIEHNTEDNEGESGNREWSSNTPPEDVNMFTKFLSWVSSLFS